MSKKVRVAAVQAEPKWFDIEAATENIINLIAEAARGGAELVVFPETYASGFPWWIWLDNPAAGMKFVPRYFENSLTRDGAHMKRIAAAAGEHGIHVVLGFSERENGTLYMSQAFMDDTGRIISVRRKLKPTHVERSVFGEGDGSDLQVHETRIGRIGGLSCWEHLQPLTKYAMASFNEEIHAAAWPSFSIYENEEGGTALGSEVATAISRVYAVETQTFTLASCAVVGQATQDLFCDTDEKRRLLPLGGGHTRIYGPEGTELATPLAETEEGLLFAELDFDLIAVAKSAADPVGHYSRPDVYQLHLNRAPVQSRRVVHTDTPASTEAVLPEPVEAGADV
ncbi:carbon-nitrogen hydrolase family protein [Streptomyces sp. NPDC026672]|uniref:carbon-nitrogen hydrolase family protein n=1 Tax=unclassified Streptomyces TaxID=2593676 RepID=UPI0033C85D21